MSGHEKRIVFYSQHLVGVGHHFRNLQIVRALARDHEVHFVDGGRPIPGAETPESVTLIRLTPIFLTPQGLASEDPTRHIEGVLEERQRVLSEAMGRICPDVFMIEFFPFDRWMLRPELIPAIEAARSVNPEVKVICSLRDIPARARTTALSGPPMPEAHLVGNRLRFYSVPFGGRRHQDMYMARRYYEEVCPTLNACFDALLIHGDPRITRLEDYFPWVDDIAIPIVYTGYVSEKLNGERRILDENSSEGGRRFVLVSAGGGLDGYELAAPCVEAWRRLCEQDAVEGREMVIFSGLFVEDAPYEALKQMCADGPFRLERFAPNFLQWMQAADLSISRAGYNTCMNVLETGTRAVFVPSRLSEDQDVRARRLADLGLAEVISPEVLTPRRIANAILRGLSRPPADHDLALDGAERTRAFIENL
jgi:predicted glycosyltransferase